MRFLSLVAAAAFVASTGLSSAADLPRKAPAYVPPAPVWSWTGFYVGVNAGGSIGRDPTSFFTGPAGGPFTTLVATHTMSPAGFIGGGQVGYNWQFAPNWVLGVEGDFQGASQKDLSCVGDCGGGGGTVITASQKIEWFATARARLGYTNGDWLWYITGGGAWAKVNNELVVSGGVPATTFDQSGWTIGGGVETHLAGGWTAKLEYLYLDLGSFSDIAVSAAGFTGALQTSDVRDHIIRVGINYKFY